MCGVQDNSFFFCRSRSPALVVTGTVAVARITRGVRTASGAVGEFLNAVSRDEVVSDVPRSLFALLEGDPRMLGMMEVDEVLAETSKMTIGDSTDLDAQRKHSFSGTGLPIGGGYGDFLEHPRR